jgi:hypothetical protein
LSFSGLLIDVKAALPRFPQALGAVRHKQITRKATLLAVHQHQPRTILRQSTLKIAGSIPIAKTPALNARCMLECKANITAPTQIVM